MSKPPPAFRWVDQSIPGAKATTAGLLAVAAVALGSGLVLSRRLEDVFTPAWVTFFLQFVLGIYFEYRRAQIGINKATDTSSPMRIAIAHSLLRASVMATAILVTGAATKIAFAIVDHHH